MVPAEVGSHGSFVLQETDDAVENVGDLALFLVLCSVFSVVRLVVLLWCCRLRLLCMLVWITVM